MEKITEAQSILKDLGLPKGQQNKVSALTFLALCGISPDGNWHNAKRKSLTLSKGIMDFVNDIYGQDYKQNTRESFRNEAINPFLNFRLIDLNPDNTKLAPQSSKTHYAIKDLVIETLKQYGTHNWENALDRFKKFQFIENIEETALIKKIVINNYKSIENIELELGRVNVFIGANGSGKSNILEAIAMMSASKGNDLDLEGLVSRGVRIAKPMLTLSSFLGKPTKKEIKVEVLFEDKGQNVPFQSRFESSNINDLFAKWVDKEVESNAPEMILQYLNEIYSTKRSLTKEDILKEINEKLVEKEIDK